MQTKHYFHSVVMIKVPRVLVTHKNEDGTISKTIGDRLMLQNLHSMIADQFSAIYAQLPERVRVKSYVNHQGLNKVLECRDDRQWSVGDVTITSPNREERINVLLDVHFDVKEDDDTDDT